ncbi:TonB-dependent receptor [Methylorubrum suomiense]|uniref:Vitamin B12 transporter BtuB n=2 Tax=Methylorubrum suomiense TaxID=144191 RepID=A0ABQ4UXP5_9HYPH|nr:TonB-dependent receptor [Methylobacterium sp. L1A1]GJE77096.1 Vitamin B12 transporter BtuB [Methylorubrum suomiense]
MPTTSVQRWLRSVSGAALLSMLGSAALAQKATDIAQANAVQLEEISVSGEKITRPLQQTASSVTVVTREEIEKDVNRNSASDALLGTPNVNFPTTGGLGGAPTIRGQDSEGPNSGATAFFGGTVPRTIVNIDGHNLTYNELVFGSVPLWDTNSIEVFRGPQTISQGANSIAGAIVIRTNDPTFVPEARFQALYGSRDLKRTAAMLNMPISDEVAARLAVDYYGRDNFINYINPAFNGTGTDLDLETANIRFKVLYRPKELPGLEAKVTYSRTFNNRPTFEAANRPFSQRNSIVTSSPTYANIANVGIFDLGYDFGNGVKIVNQFQYSDVLTKRYTAPVNNGSATIHPKNLSNESRVTFGDPLVEGLSGMVGYYYYSTDSIDSLNLIGPTRYSDHRDSLGVFGELNYRFLEKWTLSGSLRYQYDDLSRAGTSPYAREFLNYSRAFSVVLPKVTLSYDITRDVTVGALYSEGYNPGGVSLNLTTGRYISFKEESARNYELFARARLLDDRMFLTTNLFYTNFKNGQHYIDQNLAPGVFSSFTVNVDASRSYGAEIGADYLVLDNLRVKGGIGLLNTRITRDLNTRAVFQGKQFARAPAMNLKVGFDWEFMPKVTLGGVVRYTDDYFSEDANNPLAKIKSYTVADARITYVASENARLFVFCNNLLDDRSVTYQRLTRARPSNYYEGTLVLPREIGGGVEVKF